LSRLANGFSSSRRWTGWGSVWFWLIPLAFLIAFFYLPLSAVFRLAFTQARPELWWQQIGSKVAGPLGFTFGQALLSTLLTLVLGLPSAFVFARFSFWGKGWLRILTMLPFILPTVVVAAGFNALLGPRGWINLGLMELFSLTQPPLKVLNTLGIILLAHVFYNTTVVIRLVGNAWTQLDIRQEQAARVLGATRWGTFWKVILPLLRPSILAASLLVFLFSFTSFGVILLLGGPRFATLEVEIYIQALQMLDLPAAGLLSFIQLIFTLALVVVFNRLGGGTPIPLLPRLQGEGTRPPRGWRERVLVAVTLVVLVLLLLAPLAALAFRSITQLEAQRGQQGEVRTTLTLDYYRELFYNRRSSIFYISPIFAARNSLVYASATASLSLTMGFLIAYALRSKNRVNRILDVLVMLPLGTSAVTLGLGYLIVFNRPPIDLRSLPILIPFVHSLVALPFVVRTLQPTLDSIPASLRQSAAVLGASPIQVWWRIDLPILARAILTSAIFAFTISLGEFGATSFLARPEYPTMPVAIFRFLSLPGALNYGQAMAMATLLMMVCGVSIFILEQVNRKNSM
jgi:thiamine transport system permease protein